MLDDDRTLIKRILSGETKLFRFLVKRYEASVFRIVRGLVPLPEDQEDLAQEVFLSVYRNLHRYDQNRGAVITWILTIARNRCYNFLRSHRQVAPLGESELEANHRTSRSEEEQLHALLDRALAELPLDQRSVFVLVEIQRLSYEQVAEVEGVKLGTVKSRLSRAKSRLLELFNQMVG